MKYVISLNQLLLAVIFLCVFSCQGQTADSTIIIFKQAKLEYSNKNFHVARTLYLKTLSVLDSIYQTDCDLKKECLDDLTMCLQKLAESYEGVDIEKSIKYGLECLMLKKQANNTDTLSILSDLGEYYKELGDFQIAKTYLKNVLMHHNKNDNLYVNTNIRLASLYGRIGNYDSAYLYSEKARILEQTIHGSNTSKYASILMNSGLYKYMEGDAMQGTNLLKNAYCLSKCNKLDISFNLAGVFSKQKEPDSCYKYLRESWQEIKKEVSSKMQSLSKEDRYNYLIQESTYKLITSPINYYLQHEEHEGLRNLAFTCIMYYKQLSTELLHDIPDVALMESLIDSISHSLNINEVAIETWADLSDSWYADYILAFIIKPNDSNLSVIKLSKESIIKALNNEISTTKTYLPLYEYIWNDIIKAINLPKGGHIYIECNDILSQIPIESVCDYNWEYVGDIYDVVRISSITSIPKINSGTLGNSIALYGGLQYDCNQKKSSMDNLLTENRVGYNYLPWTEKEVVKIKEMIDSTNRINNVELYTGINGTKESIVGQSSHSPSILHFATHGFFLQPTIEMDWYSYHMFCMSNAGVLTSCSPDGNDDVFLKAEEIMFLNLNSTDLVVLSACNTGRSGVTPWGIVGLQQAFKTAGVNTILMTIGKVDDVATSIFMENFYRGLLNGLTKRNAFKQAQLSLRKNEYFGKFHYWAYFVMID